MLDKRCLTLLDIINEQCLNSGYKVFEFSELVCQMPENLGVDQTAIRDCLKQLCMHEYISVKYEDEREVCLSPLPKGRLVFEERIDGEIEKGRAERRYFLYAFLGSAVGGLLFMALILVLLAIGGRLC